MKKILKTTFLFLVLINLTYAQKVKITEAKRIAHSFIKKHARGQTIRNCDALQLKKKEVGYLVMLSPVGYIVTANNKNLTPVIAYSFTNDLFDKTGNSPFAEILKIDLAGRLLSLEQLDKNFKFENSRKWENLLEGKNLKKISHWPPKQKGDGFLETNWTQSHPYNMLCPLDLVNGGRSVAGCPAVAMAMILNYNKETHLTQFDDGDDYYHNYTNYFWIDNDHETYDFPSFPELNMYLDTLQYCYDNEMQPNDTMVAALNFACGVAATQVYSASISGTFGVNQAFDAYQRFNFTESELLMGGDTSIVSRMTENMMYELPVHLALVDPAGTVGHNVVTDGYNSDGYFHLNFGWGGNSNGWYTMPPTSIPYNLTVIEGVVVDINADTAAPPPQPIVADFGASATIIIEGESINFSDLSTNNPDSWVWTFEGGMPPGSTTQNPQNIAYANAGIYTVKLVASNAFSEDSVIKTGYITVEPDGLQDNKLVENIRVFPTVTKDFVYYKISPSKSKASIVVYDMRGNILYTRVDPCNEGIIDLTDYSAGLYVVQIRLDTYSLSNKILKE